MYLMIKNALNEKATIIEDLKVDCFFKTVITTALTTVHRMGKIVNNEEDSKEGQNLS
jgi:hypothetical protein